MNILTQQQRVVKQTQITERHGLFRSSIYSRIQSQKYLKTKNIQSRLIVKGNNVQTKQINKRLKTENILLQKTHRDLNTRRFRSNFKILSDKQDNTGISQPNYGQNKRDKEQGDKLNDQNIQQYQQSQNFQRQYNTQNSSYQYKFKQNPEQQETFKQYYDIQKKRQNQQNPLAVKTEKNTSKVSFKVKFHTYFGQNLKLIGGPQQFGSWNVMKALGMQWTSGNNWTCSVELPHNSVVEYKYVLVGNNNQVITWQNGNNQILTVGDDYEHLEVEDSWDGSYSFIKVNGDHKGSRQELLSMWSQGISANIQELKSDMKQSKIDLYQSNQEVRGLRKDTIKLKQDLNASNRSKLELERKVRELEHNNQQLMLELQRSQANFRKTLENTKRLLNRVEGGYQPDTLAQSPSAQSLPQGGSTSVPSQQDDEDQQLSIRTRIESSTKHVFKAMESFQQSIKNLGQISEAQDTILEDSNDTESEDDTELQEEDTQSQERDVLIQDNDTQIQDNKTQIQDNNTQILDRDTQIQDKDTQIQDKDTQIQDKDTQFQDNNTQIQDNDKQNQDNETQIPQDKQVTDMQYTQDAKFKNDTSVQGNVQVDKVQDDRLDKVSFGFSDRQQQATPVAESPTIQNTAKQDSQLLANGIMQYKGENQVTPPSQDHTAYSAGLEQKQGLNTQEFQKPQKPQQPQKPQLSQNSQKEDKEPVKTQHVNQNNLDYSESQQDKHSPLNQEGGNSDNNGIQPILDQNSHICNNVKTPKTSTVQSSESSSPQSDQSGKKEAPIEKDTFKEKPE